jgi:hypothetical protein
MSDSPRTDKVASFEGSWDTKALRMTDHARKLAKALMRLHDAAEAFAADQSESRDERCGLVQPVTVSECEELNQALKAAWELLNQTS